MDRSLDEVIQDRQRREPRRGRGGRRNDDDYPRDGIRKSTNPRNDPSSIDKAWIHDRYEGDSYSRRPHEGRDRGRDRHEPVDDRAVEGSAKLRVDNLHYDLTETDLRELFSRIGPITTLAILYDRSDRSRGIAYVTYTNARDASDAIREFDGANAYGQPISVTAVPQGPAPGRRNPFDAITPREGRSLFDRVEAGDARRAAPVRRSRRSESPGTGTGGRRSDVTKPAPEGIDRYVPGPGSRRRSPAPARRGERGGRRPGARREEGGRGNRGEGRTGQGKTRKTAEELDAEMEDYWGSGSAGAAKDPVGGAQLGETNAVESAGIASHAAGAVVDDDIDMIE